LSLDRRSSEDHPTDEAAATQSPTPSPVEAQPDEQKWRRLSFDARQNALEDLPRWDDRLQLIAAIRDHVAGLLKAAAARGRKLIVLLGEDHVSKTSLLVELGATVSDVHGKGATVMIEHTPEWVGQWDADVAAMQARICGDPLGASAKALESDMEANFESLDHNKRRMPQHVKTKSHFAKQLGFAVTGFDIEHPGLNSRSELLTKEREQAMESAISARARSEGAPVIVIAGHLHVPTLHAQLRSEFDVVTVSTVKGLESPFLPPDQIPRASYLLTHPEIKCVSTQGSVESHELGYCELIRHLEV
jgi:hypothetical protein